MKKLLLFTLALTVCVAAFVGCMENEVNPGLLTPENSQSVPEIYDPLADPDLLMPKTLESIELTATLPDGVRFHDINYVSYKDDMGEYYDNIHPGNGITYSYKRLVSGYESFGITEDIPIASDGIYIGIADSSMSETTFRILNLQAYKWHNGTAHSHKYLVAGFEENTLLTYDEIKPYIIYEDKNRLVIDSGEMLGRNFKHDMEKYIEMCEGKTTPYKELSTELTTEVYDYSWLPEAFDLVVANKDKLIVPIEE